MPSPIEVELRVQPSPVPTQIVLGFDGSIVIAPIDCTGCLSNTGRNVVPPSIDFHTPPDAAPTYRIVLPPSFAAATAATRPLIAAEPMLRAPTPETVPASTIAGAFFAGGAATGATLSGGPAITTRVTPCAGSLNQPSSTGTLISARSTVTRNVRGPPLLPLSTENGTHTPPTCW